MLEKVIVLLATAILTALSPLANAEAPLIKLDDFSYGGDLTSAKTEFRRFSVSADMIKNMQRRDLGDIRVFDGNNKLMPALVKKKGGKVKTSQQTLALYPSRATGTTSGYILDRSSKHTQSLKSLHLRWRQGASPAVLSVRIEHSADKKTWKTLKDSEMIYNIEYKGERLKQNIIDINNNTQRYIKLTFLNKRRAPALASVTAHTTSKKLPDHLWVPASQIQADKNMPNAYRFNVSKGISPDLLKFSFAKLNTILSGSLYNIATVNGKPQRKPVLNNFNAYAVTLNNKVVKAKAIDVSKWQSPEWLIITNTSTAYAEDNLPGVTAAYPHYEVIFADDGEEPYTAVWGNNTAGAPMTGDIVKRIKANKLSWKDIAVVKPKFIVDNARLTELMESRQTPWLMIGLFAIITTLALVFGYRRYQS